MHLSIVKINTLKARPSKKILRATTLSIARDLLIKNKILSIDDAMITTIQRFESGEPYLLLPKGNKRALHISISHSGPWCACIISEAERPAGIDLEDISVKRNYLSIAENYFSAYEIEYVKQHSPNSFYKLWTAKEAIAKLQGKGLSDVLKIQLNPEELERNIVSFENRNYRLTRCITQHYVCTIARFKFQKIFIES